MRVALQHDSGGARAMSAAVPVKGIAVGLIGGLAGTIAMELINAGTFQALGFPLSLSFSIIGDAAGAFLSVLGINVTGGAPLGAVLYYLIGLLLGGIFGATMWGADARHVTSMKKGAGLSILFVESMSLPMLAAAAILLKLTASDTAQWFGISFVMHLVYGVVLGAIVVYGLRRDCGRQG